MSRNVFILGAGASRDCGGPLMGDFLDKAAELYRAPDGRYCEPFDLVAKALAELQVVHSKADFDLYNLEPVYGVLEMGKMLGRLPGFTSAEAIEAVVRSLRQVIAGTLERSINFLNGSDGIPKAPGSYQNFVKLIAALNDRAKSIATAIISFNYDLLCETSLIFGGLGYDYGFRSQGNIPLLKLHGSLNWVSCSKPECRTVLPYHVNEYLQNHVWHTAPGEPVRLNISEHLIDSQLKHCESPIDPTPVIVPPTWNKTDYAPALSQVWKRAASELSDAENIFVCGYSIPETDAFFKHLFALGAVGSRLLQRFWVFDPDPSHLVESRFRKLLGPAAGSRFRMFNENFSGMVREIVSGLGLQKSMRTSA